VEELSALRQWSLRRGWLRPPGSAVTSSGSSKHYTAIQARCGSIHEVQACQLRLWRSSIAVSLLRAALAATARPAERPMRNAVRKALRLRTRTLTQSPVGMRSSAGRASDGRVCGRTQINQVCAYCG
jgi:hypothetical protein